MLGLLKYVHVHKIAAESNVYLAM